MKGIFDMAVLPDAWLFVLNALIDSPVAWSSPQEIADALGYDEDETSDLLCDLDLAGWLVVWDADAGPLVTLSPLAAERLGARLVESGARQTPRWARKGDPEPPTPRSKHVCFSERAASLEFIPDPSLPPEMAAERAERADVLSRSRQDAPTLRPARVEEPPRPTVFVGLGLNPWPGPTAQPALVCPACGNRSLLPHVYCLYCDRWGLDSLTQSATATELPTAVDTRPRQPRPATNSEANDRLTAESLRRRRKARKRQRQQAKNEEERLRKETSPNRPHPPNIPPGSSDPSPRRVMVPLHSPPPGKASAMAER